MNNHSISTTQLFSNLQSGNAPIVFDVRKRPAFAQDPRTLPSAKWQIHDEVKNWGRELDPNQKIVVYCVHGHQVSQNAAQALRDLGLNAYYLEGGFDEWVNSKLSLEGEEKQ